VRGRIPTIFLILFLIASSARSQDRRVLRGHLPRVVAEEHLQPVGSLPGSTRMHLAIGLPLRNQEALNALLDQIYDPANPDYRHYLTPEQFTERFGPLEQDYQAVIAFAMSNGLTVTTTHPNRMVLDVEGTVADIERTLHTTLRVYRHPREARTFYAPDTEPSLDLAVPVLHISGLDDYSLPHPNLKARPFTQTANATPNTGSGPNGSYRGNDFRAAYLPGTLLTGAGQAVGLLQFDGYFASDITTYEAQAGLLNVTLTNVPVDGGVSTPGSGNSEVALDIEMVISMAPGVSRIIVYEAPNPSPWVDLLSRMANDNLAKQLSCSWGGGGPDPTSEQVFRQMAAQGQSFFNASGDSDAFTGAISFPAESTNITQVGGTTLTTTGPSGSYISETVWNWGSGTGSSGGISTVYPIPTYQKGISMSANQGSTTMRNVPDVALTADNVYVVYNNGGSGIFGGTSCATPLWAAFTALMNQQAAAHSAPAVGFLNPAVYAIGKGTNYTSSFHDITTGNNFSSSSPTKFSAVAGYDLCTGWGTPNGTNLINALVGPIALRPQIVAASSTLLAEGCAPTNGAIDPGETVTVNFFLQNIGTGNTSNLVATLLATGGVTSASSPQTYGVVVAGGAAVARPFTFTANGACGGTITNTFQLQDEASNLGTATFVFSLGAFAMDLSQNFDGVAAPALPAGWTTSAGGAQSVWVTSTAQSDTSPNAAFTAGASGIGSNALVSPTFAVTTATAQLTFRNSYNFQLSISLGRDGGVLEIKIGSGSFTDILTAGGSFVSGGYNNTLSTTRGNPLGGRQAWSGNSGGFIATVVNLPAAAAGQNVQLRWRSGTDNTTSSAGWYLDSIGVSELACCVGTAANLALAKSASPNPAMVGAPLTYTISVTNNGPGLAASVTVTDALPAGVTFASATASQGTCTNIAGVVTCSLGSLANSAVATVTIGVVPNAAGSLTNTAAAITLSFDPNTTNNTATATTTVNTRPQLSVVPASRNYGTLLTGQSSNQIFSVINNGQGTLNGTATLVAAGSPFAIVGGTPYTVNGGQTSTVSVSFSPVSAGNFSNTVAFNSNGGVSSNAVTGAALSPPHLSVSPSNQNFPTMATGTTAQATFVVTNTGGAVLSGTATITATAFGIASGGSYNVAGFGSTNVVVSFTPPTVNSFTGNVVFASTGGNSTNTVTGAGAIALVASFSANITTGSPPLTVTFTDTSSGTITNRFWNFGDSSTTNVTTNPVQHTYNAIGSYPVRLIVSGPLGVSTNTQFNYIVVTNFVLQADLALTNAAPASILYGQHLSYTLTANNLGPTNAASVTVTDALPVGVTFVSVASTQGTCTNISGAISCSFGTLAASSNAVITLVVAPSGPGIVTNTAAVFTTGLDPNLANNTATVITVVSPSADVSITKTSAPNPMLTSQNLTYTLAVANLGPSTATSVIVTDALPTSVNVVSVIATVGVCTNIGGVVTCSIGNLASNAISMITIVGTATSLNNITNLLNTATVGANEFDPNPTNNTASTVTTIYLDSVGDGIPDWWRQQFFGSGTTTDATSCAACDPDGDGFGNLQEYLLGTDPTNSASALAITAITPIGADIIISFASVSGKSYELDWISDLANGTWLPVTTNIAGTGGIVQVTDPGAMALSQRFYRVQLLP
jgi:uncharacterized repeat protein (TIGR01451 family)